MKDLAAFNASSRSGAAAMRRALASAVSYATAVAFSALTSACIPPVMPSPSLLISNRSRSPRPTHPHTSHGPGVCDMETDGPPSLVFIVCLPVSDAARSRSLVTPTQKSTDVRLVEQCSLPPPVLVVCFIVVRLEVPAALAVDPAQRSLGRVFPASRLPAYQTDKSVHGHPALPVAANSPRSVLRNRAASPLAAISRMMAA